MKVRGRYAGFVWLLWAWLISSGVGCREGVPDASERHQAIQQAVYRQDSLWAQRLLDSLQGRSPAAPDSMAQDTTSLEVPEPVSQPAPVTFPTLSPAPLRPSSAATPTVDTISAGPVPDTSAQPEDTTPVAPRPAEPTPPTDSPQVPTPVLPDSTPSSASPDTTASFSPNTKGEP